MGIFMTKNDDTSANDDNFKLPPEIIMTITQFVKSHDAFADGTVLCRFGQSCKKVYKVVKSNYSFGELNEATSKSKLLINKIEATYEKPKYSYRSGDSNSIFVCLDPSFRWVYLDIFNSSEHDFDDSVSYNTKRTNAGILSANPKPYGPDSNAASMQINYRGPTSSIGWKMSYDNGCGCTSTLSTPFYTSKELINKMRYCYHYKIEFMITDSEGNFTFRL